MSFNSKHFGEGFDYSVGRQAAGSNRMFRRYGEDVTRKIRVEGDRDDGTGQRPITWEDLDVIIVDQRNISGVSQGPLEGSDEETKTFYTRDWFNRFDRIRRKNGEVFEIVEKPIRDWFKSTPLYLILKCRLVRMEVE